MSITELAESVLNNMAVSRGVKLGARVSPLISHGRVSRIEGCGNNSTEHVGEQNQGRQLQG